MESKQEKFARWEKDGERYVPKDYEVVLRLSDNQVESLSATAAYRGYGPIDLLSIFINDLAAGNADLRTWLKSFHQAKTDEELHQRKLILSVSDCDDEYLYCATSFMGIGIDAMIEQFVWDITSEWTEVLRHWVHTVRYGDYVLYELRSYDFDYLNKHLMDIKTVVWAGTEVMDETCASYKACAEYIGQRFGINFGNPDVDPMRNNKKIYKKLEQIQYYLEQVNLLKAHSDD